ncbi:MAG: hypothetical protein ABFC94_04155, partial [Syntrophomonas sp.]
LDSCDSALVMETGLTGLRRQLKCNQLKLIAEIKLYLGCGIMSLFDFYLSLSSLEILNVLIPKHV